jgi:hypothetical protein
LAVLRASHRGGIAQFTLIARYSNGVDRDVTNGAAWRSSNESVLSISPDGRATGIMVGEVSLAAAFESGTAVRNEVLVLPSGTFKLAGRVRDSIFPVPGADVSSAGAANTTAADGSYRLYGVAGDIEVRVRKEGYEDASKRLLVASPNQHLDSISRLAGRERTSPDGTR